MAGNGAAALFAAPAGRGNARARLCAYAPAYWWVAQYPSRHRHLVVIGLLGKVLGPIGFAWSARQGQLPLDFGLTILTNDLLWWPAFGLFLRAAARRYGGWAPLLRGE